MLITPWYSISDEMEWLIPCTVGFKVSPTIVCVHHRCVRVVRKRMALLHTYGWPTKRALTWRERGRERESDMDMESRRWTVVAR